MLQALGGSAAVQPTDQPVLCPNGGGAIIGLASDNAYYVRPPADGGAGNSERWVLVTEGAGTPRNSFTGQFMQVMPDDGDSYHDIYGAGSFTMTGLDFAFDVLETTTYTLFLRWTGGDTRGAGDSLYAVVRKHGTDELMPGPDTFKPKRVAIDAMPGEFTGCCYNRVSHACPCYTPDMNSSACIGSFVGIEQTSRWHPTCADSHGAMEGVSDPRWYLFAGQSESTDAEGSQMDFDAEPWDASCEAVATATKDTGQDFARWTLEPGRYHMVFYPREDGTALDAFHLVPSGGSPPTPSAALAAGATTLSCPDGARRVPIGANSDWHHRTHDAVGWGSHADASTVVGEEICGRCLLAVTASECPAPEALQTMATCDKTDMALGELCEADGECGTNVRINNCDNPLPNEGGDGGGGGPSRLNRNNDVYKRISCDVWDVIEKKLEPGSSGSGSGAVVAVVLMLIALAAASAAYVHFSRKYHGGVTVLPWKWKGVGGGARTAHVSSSTSSMASSDTYVPPPNALPPLDPQ